MMLKTSRSGEVVDLLRSISPKREAVILYRRTESHKGESLCSLVFCSISRSFSIDIIKLSLKASTLRFKAVKSGIAVSVNEIVFWNQKAQSFTTNFIQQSWKKGRGSAFILN